MGIGIIGAENIVFTNKFRWGFEAEFRDGKEVQKIPEHYVKLDSTENKITLTWFDVDDFVEYLYCVADKSIQWFDKKQKYLGEGTLRMYNGYHEVIETWELADLHMLSINFGDLGYSDEPFIEMTFGYGQHQYVCNGRRHDHIGPNYLNEKTWAVPKPRKVEVCEEKEINE